MALQGYNLPLWRKPLLLMVVAQAIIVAINILYKLAAIHAMPTPILVAYRLIFGTISLAPLTIYKSRIKVKPTWKLASLTFVCGSLGGSVYHNLYLASLKLTSATYVSAIVNLTPVITFVLTLTFRLDTLAYHTSTGRAKVVGMILSIGGVVFLSFYKRIEIDIWPIKFNIVPQDDHKTEQHTANQVLGLVFALVATLSNAGFLTIQEMFKECHKDLNIFLIPFLMNLVAAIQAVVYALCVERDWTQWKLCWNVSLWAASFAGVFGSGLITTLTIWCISKMGPLFVSNFSPVGLILMVLTGSLVLDEKLYLTSLVAIMLIIVGTLLVLWAKVKEAELTDDQTEESVAGVNQAEVAVSDVFSIEMPPDAQNDPQSEPNINRNCILLWFYKIGKSKSSTMISIFFKRFCYLASIIHPRTALFTEKQTRLQII